MNGGRPAAALLLSCTERYFFLCCSRRSSDDRSSGEELVYGGKARLSDLLCALCALESRVTLAARSRCLRFYNLCVVGGISISVTTYRMLRCWRECLSCDSISQSLPTEGRGVMEVGGGCCCCWWWWFGCSHWFVSLLCLFLTTPPRSRSLFTSLHITHTCMHTHTHRHTPRFEQITQDWDTNGRQHQIVSFPQQALQKQPPGTQNICQLLPYNV